MRKNIEVFIKWFLAVLGGSIIIDIIFNVIFREYLLEIDIRFGVVAATIVGCIGVLRSKDHKIKSI